jgi:hypothetical protein
MEDSKVNSSIYLKRLLTEKGVAWSTDLTATIYVCLKDETIMISDHEGFYMVGFYELEEQEFEGKTEMCAKDEPYDDIHFQRPDSCASFVKYYLDGTFSRMTRDELEEWKAETDEKHLRWLLENNPDYVTKHHPNWLQSKVVEVVKESLK